MRKQQITVFALAAACTLPAVAQTSGTSSSPQAGQATTAQASPDTRSMGAGPSSGTESREDGDRDIGWLGLLGLVGLLGLRGRKREDNTHIRQNTGSTMR